MKITEQIKEIEDAYQYLGLKRDEEVPFKEPTNDRQVAVNGFMDGIVISEALNERNRPDYGNYKQRKYEAYCDLTPESAGGPGLSYDVCDDYASISIVGARLVFLDPEVLKYAFTQFKDVFKSFMTFPE